MVEIFGEYAFRLAAEAALYKGVVGPPKIVHNKPGHEICNKFPPPGQPCPVEALIYHWLVPPPAVFKDHPIPALLLLAPPAGKSKLSLQNIVCAFPKRNKSKTKKVVNIIRNISLKYPQ
jgi:hypothetical protein